MLVDYKPPEGYDILFYIGQCTSNGTCVCHCGNCTSGCDACLPGWSGSTINRCQKCSIILKMTQYIKYILVYYTVSINNHDQNCITLHGHDVDSRNNCKHHSSVLLHNIVFLQLTLFTAKLLRIQHFWMAILILMLRITVFLHIYALNSKLFLNFVKLTLPLNLVGRSKHMI